MRIICKFLDIRLKLVHVLSSIRSVQEEKFKTLKDAVLKPLYDHTKKNEDVAKSSALSELIVECMDEEQMWQQLELQVNLLRSLKLLEIPETS